METQANNGKAKTSADFDGLRLALLNNRMEGVVAAMMNTLQRTARSAIMNMARDFSCGILTGDAALLTVAESLPCHSFVGPDLQARHMKEWHQLKQGDAFVANSPYHGGSHAADWCVLMPVIDDQGVHHFTVFAKAHVADCGNSIPTTFFATAKDVYQEGALIFPCQKVQSNYEIDQDFVRQCKLRLRVPEMWYGDFLAILGAARIGERRLLELANEVGDGQLKKFASAWFDYSEQKMISAIAELPSGNKRVTLMHDPIPGAPDGIPVAADVAVDSDAGKIVVDLTDNLDCQPIGLNLTESTAISNTMAGIFSSLGQQVPPNAGSFRRLDIRLRENCMIGIPRHPFSCSAATTNLAETVGKAVTVALAELGDGFGMAEIGKCLPPAMAVISGHDPRPGKGDFVNFLSLLVTNGAGAPRADGWLTVIGVGVAGLQMHDSVEVDEMKYPIEIKAQRVIQDSEGAGRQRGAPGALVEYGPVGTSVEIIYTSDGTYNAPKGVQGGLDGACAQQMLKRKDGTVESLPNFSQLTLEAGETVISMCTGGGGYGDPATRDLQSVAKDVSEGLVSVERAKRVYKVVVSDEGVVDSERTLVLRRQIAETT